MKQYNTLFYQIFLFVMLFFLSIVKMNTHLELKVRQLMKVTGSTRKITKGLKVIRGQLVEALESFIAFEILSIMPTSSFILL